MEEDGREVQRQFPDRIGLDFFLIPFRLLDSVSNGNIDKMCSK